MFPQPKDSDDGPNQLLLDAVPDTALLVVETGGADSALAAELKARVPGRTVINHDVTSGPPPVEAGTVDVVLFDATLERLVDPEAALAGVRGALAPDGRVIASIHNVAHHSVLEPLLRGDFMYQPHGQLDAAHLRFFSYATIWKLFLDAGYVPQILAIDEDPISDPQLTAFTPALLHHRVDPARARKHLGAAGYIVEGRPGPAEPDGFAAPLTFACLTNDPGQLESNLLRSPIFAPGSPHELIPLPGYSSAAEGLLAALGQASYEIVVLVQQDMYLPRGWDHAFRRSWEQARTQFGEIGMAGLYGLKYPEGDHPGVHVGRVIDRDRLLDEPTPLPATVDSLDEILLAVPRDTPLVPDPGLGFHLYGADLAFQAAERGLPVVVLEALTLHNSLFARLDAAFDSSRHHLLDKWSAKRPVRTLGGPLDELRMPPPSVHWPTKLRSDLDSARQTLGDRDKELAATRRQLQAANARLERVQASRTWRARTAAVNGLRRIKRRG